MQVRAYYNHVCYTTIVGTYTLYVALPDISEQSVDLPQQLYVGGLCLHDSALKNFTSTKYCHMIIGFSLTKDE